MIPKLKRSVLAMPGSNARALEKGKTLAADALMFELEDGVAESAKATAREQVVAALKGGGYGKRQVIIRVNEPARRGMRTISPRSSRLRRMRSSSPRSMDPTTCCAFRATSRPPGCHRLSGSGR